MGWTFTNDTSKSALEHAKDEFRRDPNLSIVAAYGRYLAVHDKRDDTVTAFVVATESTRHERAWKTMHENMGPYASAAPKSLLNKLSPTTDTYASEWRQRCLWRAERAAAVKKGTTIRLSRPLRFTNGQEYDTFTFVKGSRFITRYGVPVNLTNWRDRDFDVL
jgi:hypothetical protein